MVARGTWTVMSWLAATQALTYSELTRVLDRQILPSDNHERLAFDIRTRFELGDPHVHYHAPAATEYEKSGACGCPDWPRMS